MNYYLKCTNCGHLNEIRSEFQVFCSACGKKLDNNFADWKKVNPNGTLEEYRRLLCISDIEMAEAEPQPESVRSGRVRIISGIIIGLIIVLAGVYAVFKFYPKHTAIKTSQEATTGNWMRQTYGTMGLSLETPVKLTPSDLPLNPAVEKLVNKMEVFRYTTGQDFFIMANSASYNPEVGVLNLQGGADGSANEIRMASGVIDFTYTERHIQNGQIPGIVQQGSYKQNGVALEFYNAIYAQGLTLWQVLVGYKTTSPTGKSVAERVLGSVVINQ